MHYATQEQIDELLAMASKVKLPEYPETEAEEDAFLTLQSLREGNGVSLHEWDAAYGYVKSLELA